MICSSSAVLAAPGAAGACLHLAGRVLPCPSPATTQQGGLERRSQPRLQSRVLAGHCSSSPWSRHIAGLWIFQAKGPVVGLASLRRFPHTLERPDKQQRMLCSGCQKTSAITLCRIASSCKQKMTNKTQNRSPSRPAGQPRGS